MYCELPRKKVFKNQNGLLINQYLIDTIQDISTLPTQISKPTYDRCAAGSIAYCIENQNYYILNNNNEWLVYDENGEGSNNSINKKIENDITFYDYDGTIVASYSISDFMELDSLPENPNHTDEGLTSQGWNWNLTDAKAYVAKYGRLNVGQMYVPTDEKTHVFINIPKDDPSYETTLYFGHTAASGQTVIDWGDGTATETANRENTTEHSHTYANPGKYEITLDTMSGVMNIIGTSDNKTGTHFSGSGSYVRNLSRIEKIHFSTKISIGNYAFYSCFALRSVTIPEGVTSIGSNVFAGCYALQSVTIPDSLTSIGRGAFQLCFALRSVTIPEGVTSIGSNVFQNCFALQNVTIPEGVTSIENYMFSSCYALQSVTIPEGVTSIGSNAFSFCDAIIAYHFKPNTPPTLSSGDFYISPDTVFYVPIASLEAYKTDTNWSTYADRIFAEPE